MPLGFAYPWVLVLWLPLLGTAWYWRARLWAGGHAGYVGLRLLSLAMLVAALAQPYRAQTQPQLAVLLDASQSVGQAVEALWHAVPHASWRRVLQPQLYHFATEAVRGDASSLLTSHTNIARALQVAAANGAGRVLLISDGVASQGDALRVASPDMPIDTLFVASRNNVRLRALHLPDTVSPGQRFEAVAVLESNYATTVTLQLETDGRAQPPIVRQLRIGRNSIPLLLTAPETGSLAVRARITTAEAQPQQDDQQQASVRVEQAKAVLVIGDPALAALLETQQIPHQLAELSRIPELIQGDLQTYSAIAIRAGAGAFSQGQLALLRRYVQEGGGLLMTGGPQSFGLGAWYRTPLAEVLPVDTELRSDINLPLVALVMIIDRSNSMASGRPAKLELAKEGAIRVVELAHTQDTLGLMTFSSGFEWVFRPQRSSRPKKQAMVAAIAGIDSEGGTVLPPAYREAVTVLQGLEAAIKHIIILSDGQLSDANNPFGSAMEGASALSRAAQEAEQEGITTSTIAVGASADFAQLERIAQAGGGRYYAAMNASTLPDIFTSEAVTVSKGILWEGSIPVQANAHALLANDVADVLPPLRAYIATRPKAGSEVVLEVTPEGRAPEPVLAIQRQGLGRSAALTTDLNGWTGALGDWQGLSPLLVQLLRWLQTNPNTYLAEARYDDDALLVSVDAVHAGNYVDGERLQLRYQGIILPLSQRGLGHYQARVPLHRLSQGEEGGEVSILGGERGEQVLTRATVPPSYGEFAQHDGAYHLAQLSARSGGTVLTLEQMRQGYAPPLGGQRSLWRLPWLLVALVAFILELILRRFGHHGLRRGRSRRSTNTTNSLH